jgi:DNA topoisomerase-2
MLTDMLVAEIDSVVKKKHKKAEVKKPYIKQHLWVFVNCLIENPSFDS